MVCFPEVQMKAQAELDRVVSGRLPDFGDMPDLPYLTALVKEVFRSVFFFVKENVHNHDKKFLKPLLRWQPVFPYGKFTLGELKNLSN